MADAPCIAGFRDSTPAERARMTAILETAKKALPPAPAGQERRTRQGRAEGEHPDDRRHPEEQDPERDEHLDDREAASPGARTGRSERAHHRFQSSR
jgi:hypothetical protein